MAITLKCSNNRQMIKKRISRKPSNKLSTVKSIKSITKFAPDFEKNAANFIKI